MRLKLGKGVFIGNRVVFDNIADGAMIEIGDDVTLADEVIILVHDASSNRRIEKTWIAPVKIGNRSFIGARSVLMPGVTIGDDAVIGAGSLVIGDVKDGTVVAGVPAKKIGLTQELDDKRLSMCKVYKQFAFSTHDREHPLAAEHVEEMIQTANRDGGFFIVNKVNDDMSKR